MSLSIMGLKAKSTQIIQVGRTVRGNGSKGYEEKWRTNTPKPNPVRRQVRGFQLRALLDFLSCWKCAEAMFTFINTLTMKRNTAS